MAEFVLSRQADRDLIDIFKYIAKRSSRSRAKTYIRRLEKTMQSLADTPGMGTPRDYTPPGVVAFPKDEYVIFYRLRQPSIEILRVLHATCDMESLL